MVAVEELQVSLIQVMAVDQVMVHRVDLAVEQVLLLQEQQHQEVQETLLQ
jgi:hypothetical protein